MTPQPKTAVTFLAPNMLNCYQAIVDHISKALGFSMTLAVGTSYEEAAGADLSFICGLPYVLYTAPYRKPSALDAIAAPVLKGERYQDKPIYFSDVIVHKDSPFHSFDDLRGCSWAYNEPESQSGYGITRYHLATLNETQGYFGKVVGTGFHQKSIRFVTGGKIDATAIDSQVMAVEMRDYPKIAEKLRIIGTLGPSTIQPIAVKADMPATLKNDIQAVIVEMHHDPAIREHLDFGFIDRFVSVADSTYDDIRAMLETCEKANFLELR